LLEFDYTDPGAYFITIVTHEREPLFGKIVGGEMRLTEYGSIAKVEWFKTTLLRSYVELYEDQFIVMPDHIHGIIWINETIGAERGSALEPKLKRVEQRPKNGCRRSTPTGKISKPPRPGSLAVIVRAYKSAVSFRINTIRLSRGMPIWQRNYFEHVIRDDNDLETICAYISGNPSCWETDDPFQFPIRLNTRRIITQH
jgi:putative transposase